MCTLEEMLSDGAGITLNNDGEKTPHVSLTSPSFSEFEYSHLISIIIKFT